MNEKKGKPTTTKPVKAEDLPNCLDDFLELLRQTVSKKYYNQLVKMYF